MSATTDSGRTSTALPDSLGQLREPSAAEFVPETLMDALNRLALEAYEEAKRDPEFQARARLPPGRLRRSPLPPLPRRASDRRWPVGPRFILEREDLVHTGAHKINNAASAQVMIARRMSKTQVIAETEAPGQHGVATTTACAPVRPRMYDLHGARKTIRRQKLNVFGMKTMGANVVPVTSGSRTLPRRHQQRGDARLDGLPSEADSLHDWQRGRTAPVSDDRARLPGGHPAGRAEEPVPLDRLGRLPDALIVACVGGGSNAAGMFFAFLDDEDRSSSSGAEAGGRGPGSGEHASSPHPGSARRPPRQLQLRPPERGWPDRRRPLDLGRSRLPRSRPRTQLLENTGGGSATRRDRRRGPRNFQPAAPCGEFSPRGESSHALAQAFKEAARLGPEKVLVVCLSGRGDKDAYEVARLRGEPMG